MTGYILRRLLVAVLLLVAVVLVTFLVFYGTPRDPAKLLCGKPCTADQLARVRDYMQLDHGVLWQFFAFLGGLFAGRTYGSGALQQHCPAPCLGYSFPNGAPAADLIWDRLPVTLSVAAGAAILALLLGLGLGAVAGWRRDHWPDHLAAAYSTVGLSVPTFLIGLLAVLVFGFQLDMIPYSGYVPLTESPIDWAWHLVGPWLVLAIPLSAGYVRVTRSQLTAARSAQHLLAMRSRGARRRTVRRHSLRGVMVPVLTMFGLDAAALLGGTVITERVFSLHGLGDLLIESVTGSDLGLVVGLTVVSSAFIIIGNLVLDLALPLMDPRIRRG